MDLSQFSQDSQAEGEKDIIGGGGFLQDSDAKEWTIKFAYLDKSAGGAANLNLRMVDSEGKEYRETIYFTNKKGETFYEREGKRHNLPGFNQVQAICLLAGKKELKDMTTETQAIPVYDFDAKTEVIKEMACVKELDGAKAIFAILRFIEDKKKKNESTGTYEATGETREANRIDKVFQSGTKRTVAEVIAKKETGEFLDKWLEKHQNQVIDLSKGKSGAKSGNSGDAPKSNEGGGSAKSGESLFS